MTRRLFRQKGPHHKRSKWTLVRRSFVLLTGLLAAGLGGGYAWLSTSLPKIDGAIAVPGLSGRVEIIRDANAVPHIRATTQEDAWFALGFLHAQDRLWQMEMQRRAAAGRLSELIGSRGLETDRFMRTIGLYRATEEGLAALSSETRRAMEAYAAGVNAWMAQRQGALPLEFVLLRHEPEPWTLADSAAFARLMSLQLTGNWKAELLRARMTERLTPEQIADLYPDHPDGAPITLAELGDLRGHLDRLFAAVPEIAHPRFASNNWVVGGARTASAKPVLANDPHLGLTSPGVWYLARIEAPGLSVAGATAPGSPFVLLGHNGKVAWGFTTTQSDVQDLFVEKIDPNDPTRYLTPDGPKPFDVRNEVIKVKGAPDEVLPVRSTRHGPVLSDVIGASTNENVMALSATFLRTDDRTVNALGGMNKAADAAEFLAALRDFHAPEQNIVYADTAGTIGYVAPARIPLRARPRGLFPTPGWTGEDDWLDELPFEELPQIVNPPAGFVATANNRIVPKSYPHYITDEWDAHYRYERIEETLREAKGHTPADSAALQMDTLSPMARDMLPRLLAVEPPDDARARAALDLLRKWDGRMVRNRPEPLIFAAWTRMLEPAVIADELGPLFPDYRHYAILAVKRMMAERPQWCDDVSTPATETCDDRIRLALVEAVADLAKRYGDDPKAWRWGAAHRAAFPHRVLDSVPVVRDIFAISVETDGGNFTVNRGAFAYRDDAAPFAHVHGSGLRAVYDLANLDASRFIATPGQSGNPLSPYYSHWAKPWSDGGAITIPEDRARTLVGALGTLELRP